MSLETNFNVSPYFDDYDEAKEFYKILFRPSVSVQVRELNQLQTILQNQIERFGSHVFKNGTIVSGVNFEYIPYYPFIKLKDTNADDQPIDIETYSNYWLKNSSNLVAKAVNFVPGVESQDPDLNTIYLKYLNSGSSNTSRNYSNNDVLTVYSIDNPIFKINVYNGGLNFSNSDVVVFQGALAVNVVSGTFSNGETITQATTGAQAQIFQINTTAVADTTLLKVKPLTVDLSNTAATSARWTFNTGGPGLNITGGSSGAAANVVSIIGGGAVGSIVTDSLGTVQSIDLTSTGSEYLVTPYTTIKPQSAAATVSALNVQSQNYLTQITVANSSMSNPVWGNGYAFAVTSGIIYQKGHFLKVDPQVIIVDKYSSSPNNVVIGFDTTETVVASTTDTSLLDNSNGTLNYSAPGANRLKLVPTLVKLTKEQSNANTSFLPLVEFVAGQPHKENRVTVYSTLGKEFERRTFESAGDYVIDPFLISTKDTVISSSNSSPNNTHFKVVVDPGSGYIAGSRVQTLNNALIDVPKATTTQIKTSQLITTSYGSYTLVKELVGSFNVNAGSSVSLRDTAAAAATNTTSWGVTSPGNEIGTAKVRSFLYNSGNVGLPSCLYELYLFDITMNAGKNFRDVRSIYYNGTGVADAIADCNLELDASLNSSVAVLKQPSDRDLVFDTGFAALKAVNTAVFEYRSTNESLTIDGAGAITISLTSSGETFPYTPSAALSSSQELDVVLIPTANLQATVNVAGWVAVTNNEMVGTFTTFISDLRVGDYIKVANSTANQIFGIAGIANNTLATVTANAVSMNTIQANVMLFFPAFRPLNFSDRDSRTITNSSQANVLTAGLNLNITGSGTTILGNYTVRNSTSTQVTRSVYRDCYVKLNLGTHSAGYAGPWCLGVPDAIRLKSVYLGSSSSVSTSDPDVVKNFYIDNNQKSGYYGLSYLKLTNDSNLTLASPDYLLVRFDLLQHSAQGYKTVSSFNIDDSKTLEQSNNTINVLEIPEYNKADLRNFIDFRPVVTATATVSNTVGSATVNPGNTESLGTTNKYFPVPDSNFTYNTEFYLGRRDRVIINRNNNFNVLQGTPGTDAAPVLPPESLSLGEVIVPPYPSIGTMTTNTVSTILTKRVGDYSGIKNTRKAKHFIATSNIDRINDLQPPQYTMKDIMHLEQRLYNIERKVSFSRIENEISKLSIPSTIDPTVTRYINGFFVDSFTDDGKLI